MIDFRSILFPLFLPFLVAGIFSSADAQPGPQVSLVGGPQSTWMLNQMDSDEGEQLNYSPTYGSQFGVKVGFFFSEKIGIETGFIRSEQGQEYEHSYDLAGVEREFSSSRNLTYNKIPILLHYRSKPDEPAYFSLILGPQIGMLSDFESSSGNPLMNWGEEEDYTETTTDLVLGFGPGFSITDKFKLDLNFRFDYSLTDAENKDAEFWNNFISQEERPATHNLTGALQVGLTYGFGG